MNNKLISIILVFLILFNFGCYVRAQAVALTGTTVGLLVFGTLLVTSGIYVSSKTDTQILYDTFLTTVDSLNTYNEWAKLKFAAALGVGKWAFDKSEEYVEHFVDTMEDWVEDLGNNYVSISPPSFEIVRGEEVLYLNTGDTLYLRDYVDFSEYGGYLDVRDLTLDVIINGNLTNLYWKVVEVGEGYNKYKYDFFINGVKSEENPFYWTFGGMDSKYYVGLQDTLRIEFKNDKIYFSDGRIAFGDGYGGRIKGWTEPLSELGLDYDVPPVVSDISGYLGDDNIIDNPDIELGVNNPTMPLVNVDEFGAYYDDSIGQYVFEGDIDSLIDALENTGQLDNVLDRTLGLQKEGVDSLPNVKVNEGEGVVTWDKVDELDTSIPDVSNPDIPNVWERLFVPSEVDLDFSPLMDISLSDRFPFCIPFDFAEGVKLFSAQAKEPHFVIDLDTKFLSVYHEIDLSPFVFYISFFRYVILFWFSYILLSKTRDFIKW